MNPTLKNALCLIGNTGHEELEFAFGRHMGQMVVPVRTGNQLNFVTILKVIRGFI